MYLSLYSARGRGGVRFRSLNIRVDIISIEILPTLYLADVLETSVRILLKVLPTDWATVVSSLVYRLCTC